MSASSFEEFKRAFKGEVVTQADDGYDEAIARWSIGAVRKAKVVAFVKDAEDASLAIKYAKTEKLPLAIRGGGHSPAAASSSEGGLVVDLSRHLNKVTIDAEKKLAFVDGGAVWETVDKTAIQHGLASVGGTVNHTGVGGLTLGGGYGFLSAQYGLVIDNLVQVTMVVGDGSVLTANDNENPDLFWAVRGGGCNFGVCTQFVLKLHDQRKTVYSGVLIFPPPLLDQLFKVVNKWWDSNPTDKSAMFMVFAKGPPPERLPCAVVIPFHNGSEEEGREAFKFLLDLKPLDHSEEMPFELVNSLQNPNATPGQNVYFRAVTQTGVHPDVCAAAFKYIPEFSTSESRFALIWELVPNKKINSVSNTAMAFNCRGPQFNVLCVCQWDTNDPESNKAARDKVFAATDMIASRDVDPDDSRGKSYGNYIGDEYVAVDRAKQLFGSNYPRLQQIKQKYDPDVVFSKWFSIVPDASSTR
ncbi:FAD-binding domain-containing protein [Schizopora paradoxa]|uniref:FAD-binding domain-containing protein n=1 Tax=Schizopora paradoxa TaxID=27342 RepID=A0A0H2RRP4_9AGAM|nr:FAD-binding domain-containing protein [Schizopora paradoxa]